MALVKTANLTRRTTTAPAAPDSLVHAAKPRPSVRRRKSERRETAAERMGAATAQLAGGLAEAAAAAEELQRALGEIASGAEEAAGAAQESLAATAAMEALFGLGRERAETARQRTSELQGLAIQSRAAVDASILAIEANARRQVEGVTLIETLERDAAQIGEITERVATIADQTNLLALNAAIEAARAGDQGRVFTVLADDVRGLAQRAEAQSRSIGTLATEIAESVRDAAERTRRAAAAAELEAADARVAGEALERVRDGMARLASASQEILLASVEAVIAVGECRRGGENIASAAEEQAAATAEAQRAVQQQVQSLEQSQIAADRLANLADDLLTGAKSAGALEIAAAAEELSATVQELAGAAGEILIAVDQIRRGAQVQASASQQSSAAMGQVEAAARLASDRSAANVREIAQMQEVLAETRRVVVALSQGVTAAVAQNKVVLEVIDRLEDRSAVIGRVVEGLALVALQTTMLASSSAVEAARAGEEGDGFALVAADIRKLAADAGDNADIVKELVARIARQAGRARRELDRLSALAEAEVEKNHSMVESLTQLAADAATLGTGADEIARGASEILIANSQVLTGVSQIAVAAEQAERAAGQSAAAAQQQSDGAESLAAAIEEIASLAGDLQADQSA